ncbi:MAG TPA: potassium transporter Kup [Xanthobacteraceae bacterium]|nr:potassium transporter Kup [Xanthobacteraceae bacterium]
MAVPSGSELPANGTSPPRSSAGTAALALGSIGVVYGDIGTSPLYAVRESVNAAVGVGGTITAEAVYGILSLIFWSLIIVVTIKYITILVRADNNGEGGTLSLTALASRAFGGRTPLVLGLGIVGAAMFYGSSLITPALSVLSAVEGLNVATTAFDPHVLWLTVLILVALFSVQSRGTARVSALFGPVTTLWFIVIACAGAVQIVANPAILLAVNPYYAIAFFLDNGRHALVTLGAVFLVVTGSEALYNDLGHFGRRPIQLAWLYFVLPALVINYFGQGALLLGNPDAIKNPFYLLFPEWALYPTVGLATAATVIASQAVITGAYSITRQAIQLGLLPRLQVRHTSEALAGQIYMPRVNWLLLAGVLFLVLVFRSSSNLAHAYVLAVSTTNLMSALLGLIVIWKIWQWRPWVAALVMVPLIAVDAIFVLASLLRIVEGAWLPVLVGVLLVLVMVTWQRGTRLLLSKTRRTEVPLKSLLEALEKKPPPTVPGTAIFLTSDPEFAPTALLHNLKHNKVLHENNVILTIVTADTPRVSDNERVTITRISPRFMRITLKFGFMETPHVPRALAIARKLGFHFDIMSTSFFLSRRALKPAAHSGMPRWQDRLFIALAKSANDATDFFHIPTDRVVEVGTQVTV